MNMIREAGPRSGLVLVHLLDQAGTRRACTALTRGVYTYNSNTYIQTPDWPELHKLFDLFA